MPIPSTPSIMPNVLGYAADTVQIPETTPTGQGIPSFRDLFPFITQVDPDAGGVMVERAWMNALFNLLGQHAFFQQSGCVYPWQATLNYITGSHVKGSDDVEYIALQHSGPDVSGVGVKDPTQEVNRNYWISITSFVSSDLVPNSRRIIAGTGLTGGGVLSQDVTLAARPYQGATEAQPGVSGIVPGAPIGAQNKVFSGRGDYIPTAQIGDISVNEDLNTYNTIGFYTCTSNFIAGTIQNSPTNIAFSLLVEKAAGPVQTLKEYSTDGTARIFWRTQDEFSGAWGAWSQLPNSILKNTQVVVTTRGTPAYAPSGGTWICRGVSVRFDAQATASELALFMLDNVSSVIVPGGTKIRDTQASTGVIYWCDQIEP